MRNDGENRVLMSMTLDHLRRQAITNTLFPPTTLEAALSTLGFVQVDPLAAPARAQDLVLRHRVAGYKAGDIEQAYPEQDLEEDVLHVYGYLPARTLDWLRPRPQHTWRVEREHPDLVHEVMAFVRAQGPSHHRHLEAHFSSPRTAGSWGTEAKATTRLLDMLHYRGELRIARREGNLRYYEVAPSRTCVYDAHARLQTLLLLVVRLYAPITELTLRDLVNRLRHGIAGIQDHRKTVSQMVQSGLLRRTQVDGIGYIWPAEQQVERELDEQVRLLAPFDPIVYDRARFEHLWGWPYRFEAYTPPAKRRWGHYALPLLWRDAVIGWANVSVTDGRLVAELGYVHKRPTAPAFTRELEAELARLAAFLGCDFTPELTP